MVRLFKYLLLIVLLLALLAGGAVLWVRYEYQRATEQGDLGIFEQPARSLAAAGATSEHCAQRYPQRRAWFGALHVHTAASYDATAFGVQTTVDQAYRYARGESVPLSLRGDPPDFEPPLLTISSPLDFMAVTDHAGQLGENRLCFTEGSAAYGTLACGLFRGDIRLPVQEHMQSLMRLASLTIFGDQRSARVCGADGSRCREWALEAWQENQRQAEAHQDRSADCSFTTFHGYEYTLAKEASNLHRNVIFGSDSVPQAPLSFREAGQPEQLWRWLEDTCIGAGTGCDALAIPHNSNWSNGRMFFPPGNLELPRAEQRELAGLRARLEPLAEIMQVKGDSECRNGIASVLGAADEFCDFEKLRVAGESIPDCGEGFGSGAMMLKGCTSRYSFVRYALTAGLRDRAKLGINPFEFGIVAASDTHIGMPSAGRERGNPGAHGNDRDLKHRLISKVEVPGDIAAGSPVRYNPGGLAGVYAEENSRESLFAAMKRRETFGTSGPRITPRFFAGHGLSRDLCQAPDGIEQAYRQGVPMGGVLVAGEGSPVFLASASSDPRAGANLLQRIQIVKGWSDGSGQTHQAVYDVAGDPDNGASVDPDSCEVSGAGFVQLCTTWQDPDFDPAQGAVYYSRVLENPSCRWSRHDCNALPEAERPASCSDPALPWQIQERAWTSPIWYYPD